MSGNIVEFMSGSLSAAVDNQNERDQLWVSERDQEQEDGRGSSSIVLEKVYLWEQVAQQQVPRRDSSKSIRERRRQELSEKLMHYIRLKDQLYESLQVALAERDDARAQVQGLSTQLCSSREQSAKQLAETQAALADAEKLVDTSRQHLQQVITAIFDELGKLEEATASDKHQADEAITALETELAEAEECIGAMAEEKSELCTVRDELRAMLQAALAERDQALLQVEDLSSQLSSSNEEREAAVQEAICSLEEQLEELQSDIAAARSERSSLLLKLQEAQQLSSCQQAALVKLQAALQAASEAASSQKSDLEAKLQSAQGEVLRLTGEIARLDKKLASMQDSLVARLVHACAQRDEARKQVLELQDKLGHAKKDLASLSRQLSATKSSWSEPHQMHRAGSASFLQPSSPQRTFEQEWRLYRGGGYSGGGGGVAALQCCSCLQWGVLLQLLLDCSCFEGLFGGGSGSQSDESEFELLPSYGQPSSSAW